MVTLRVNGRTREVDAEPNTPLLWVLRDDLRLTGTKYGCGVAQCGACTVHIDGRAVRSCVSPASAAQAREVITIEGVSGKVAKAVQDSWRSLDVVQCGYYRPPSESDAQSSRSHRYGQAPRTNGLPATDPVTVLVSSRCGVPRTP